MTAERPSDCFPRAGPCEAVCATSADRVASLPHREKGRGVGPFVAPKSATMGWVSKATQMV